MEAGRGGFAFSRFLLLLWSVPKTGNAGKVVAVEFPFPSLPFLFALLELYKQKTAVQTPESFCGAPAEV